MSDALEQAIRADERAREAHARIDRLDRQVAAFGIKLDDATTEIYARFGVLENKVTRITATLAVVSGLAAFVGSASVALLIHYT